VKISFRFAGQNPRKLAVRPCLWGRNLTYPVLWRLRPVRKTRI
jgi:hypothetical protein